VLSYDSGAFVKFSHPDGVTAKEVEGKTTTGVFTRKGYLKIQ
jgi:hypothetical protein